MQALRLPLIPNASHSQIKAFSQSCFFQFFFSILTHTNTLTHNRSTMLGNFTKKIVHSLLGEDEVDKDELLDRQTAQIQSGVHHIRPDINSHWASAIADTIQVPGCSCIWCWRIDDLDEEVERGQPSQSSYPPIGSHKVCRSPMATTSEVMEVLYPPSYLNTPSALDPEASPPAYEVQPIVPPNTPQALPPLREGKGLIPSTPNLTHRTPDGVPTSYTLLDVAVPSTQSASPRLSPCLAEPRRRSGPIIGLGLESPEAPDKDEPPVYSRFESSRPQFPAASDNLGPYPHISVLSPNLG
ncbi:hypothetical protein DFH29DRAFT_903641 [Suillus ampliporus]|nr:hypothetical protein DFH29DRAFT_903641 [Suillus ampliporus]